MNQNNSAQPGLTDDLKDAVDILRALRGYLKSHRINGPTMLCTDGKALNNADDEVLRALKLLVPLSKLRAPVADERAAELMEEARSEGHSSVAAYVDQLKTSAATYRQERNSARDAVARYRGESIARAALASAPVAREAQAWMHENDPTRVISAQQKAQAERDGGAYASSLRPYTVPLCLYAAPQASAAPVAFSKDGVLFWYGDHAARRGFNGDLYLAPLASEAVGDADIPASLAQLVAAVKGMTKLYPHVWDRTDGGLVVFPENVARFDAAFDALRIAVGEAVDDDESAALSAQSVLSSGAPNGRKRTAAERRAPMVERVYGTGVTAQPAQKEQRDEN